MNQLSEKQLQVHVPIVGWLMIVSNALLVLVGLFVFALLAGVGVAVEDVQATNILVIVGVAVAAFLTLLAVPGLAAGIGLLGRRTWARILAIVVGLIGLFNFPIGTLIGGYAIWVLLQDAATDYFARRPAQLQPVQGPAG